MEALPRCTCQRNPSLVRVPSMCQVSPGELIDLGCRFPLIKVHRIPFASPILGSLCVKFIHVLDVRNVNGILLDSSNVRSFSRILRKFNKTSRLGSLDGFRRITSRKLVYKSLPMPIKYKYEGLWLNEHERNLYSQYEFHQFSFKP